jgi:hypothetical protein
MTNFLVSKKSCGVFVTVFKIKHDCELITFTLSQVNRSLYTKRNIRNFDTIQLRFEPSLGIKTSVVARTTEETKRRNLTIVVN